MRHSLIGGVLLAAAGVLVGPTPARAQSVPFTDALKEREAWVVKNDVPQLSTERLTLTAPVMSAARCVMFLVSGHDKSLAL